MSSTLKDIAESIYTTEPCRFSTGSQLAMILIMEESPSSHLFLMSVGSRNSQRREDIFSIIVDRLLLDEVEEAVVEAGWAVGEEGTGLHMGG